MMAPAYLTEVECNGSVEWRLKEGTPKSPRGPFLESPGNFSGPKSQIQIEI